MQSSPNQSESFEYKSSKKNIICSDFVATVLSINAYLCGNIIAAIILILVLDLIMGSGVYLCHYEYKVMFCGQADTSSIYKLVIDRTLCFNFHL